MMASVRIGLATLVLAAAIMPSAYAQSDDNQFAIGGNFGFLAAPDDDARGSKNVGLLWRFGQSETGWGGRQASTGSRPPSNNRSPG